MTKHEFLHLGQLVHSLQVDADSSTPADGKGSHALGVIQVEFDLLPGKWRRFAPATGSKAEDARIGAYFGSKEDVSSRI